MKYIILWILIVFALIGIIFASVSFIFGFIFRYIYGGFMRGYKQAEKDLDATFLELK